MTHTLTIQGQNRITKAKSHLNAGQILFAEWLALPPSKRIPLTQKELAKGLGVGEDTLCHWKNIPEVWEVRDDAMGNRGKEAVAKAQAILEDMLDSPNTKYRFEAAKDIMDRFGEATKYTHIIASIKDMYEKYQ